MFVVDLFGDNDHHPCGKFGMTLTGAKAALQAKVEAAGLTCKVTTDITSKVFITFDLSPPKGTQWPWKKLRTLADELGANYDESGDPPWGYTLKPEERKDVPEGGYVRL